MARGWESKFVEEQMAERRPASGVPHGPLITPQERQELRQRRSLEMSLARVRNDLSRCRDPRYRAMLEAARADLEAKLTRLG